MTKIETFGDVRRLIIESIDGIRSGAINPTQGAVMAAHFKCLNDNINAEINAAKVSIVAKEKGHNFGIVMQMGTRLIGGQSGQLIEQN